MALSRPGILPIGLSFARAHFARKKSPRRPQKREKEAYGRPPPLSGLSAVSAILGMRASACVLLLIMDLAMDCSIPRRSSMSLIKNCQEMLLELALCLDVEAHALTAQSALRIWAEKESRPVLKAVLGLQILRVPMAIFSIMYKVRGEKANPVHSVSFRSFS